MPRSKRKAAQAKLSLQPPDFTKKKTRLGKRKPSANETSTSFKSRQVHVPAQGRQPTSPTTKKPGLTLPELLQRASHYNTSTRVAAFNGLHRALRDTHAAAYVQTRLHISAVLSSCLDRLCDEEAAVRRAAREVGVECMKLLKDVGPFGKLIAANLNAALTHVRKEVCLDGARAIREVLESGDWDAARVFRKEDGNPLEALGQLLGGVSGAKARVCVLRAIAAVCRSRARVRSGGDVGEGSGKVFYYHRGGVKRNEIKYNDEDDDDDGNELLLRMDGDGAEELLRGVCYLGMECFPIGECIRDSTKKELLCAVGDAVRELTCSHSMGGEGGGGREGLRRLLKRWGKEMRGVGNVRGVEEAEVGLGMSCVKGGFMDIGGEYLVRVMSGGGGGGGVGVEGLDRVVGAYLRAGNGNGNVNANVNVDVDVIVKVCGLWGELFRQCGESGESDWVERSIASGRLALEYVCRADKNKYEEMVEMFARTGMEMAVRGQWGAGRSVLQVVGRELRKGWMGDGCRACVASVVARGVVDGVHVEDVIGSCLFYSGAGVDEGVLREMLRRRWHGSGRAAVEACVRQARMEMADTARSVLRAEAALRTLLAIEKDKLQILIS